MYSPIVRDDKILQNLNAPNFLVRSKIKKRCLFVYFGVEISLRDFYDTLVRTAKSINYLNVSFTICLGEILTEYFILKTGMHVVCDKKVFR